MNILVCDDQREAAEKVQGMIEKLAASDGMAVSITVMTKFDEPANISFGSYDMAFLDIDMGSCNGISLARELHDKAPNTIIVFVTNYIEYAPAGYEVKAFRYMLKSEMNRTMPQIFKAAVAEYAKLHRVLSFTINAVNMDIPAQNIVYLESHQRMIEIHLADNKMKNYRFYASMAQMAEKLAPMGFLRIQRSFLVNMEYIEYMQYGKTRLTDGTELTVSEKYYTDVKRQFTIWRSKNRWNIV